MQFSNLTILKPFLVIRTYLSCNNKLILNIPSELKKIKNNSVRFLVMQPMNNVKNIFKLT